MKRKNPLRLVVTQKNPSTAKKLETKLKDIYDDIFVSKNEKIYVLKDIITRMYRDYEISTGICDVPYFVKAENKMREIIAEGSVNYYYRLLKKFKRDAYFRVRKVQ